jgi:Ca-activated chloride channel family protein
MKASVRFDHELLAVEGEHTVHAMLEVVAPAAEVKGNRPPLSLALVIDRSGSMSGAKLEHTKDAAAFLVRRLAKDDKLALVTYDDQVDLLASLGTKDQSELLTLISQIFPGGTTNLSGGWLKGAEELKRASGEGPRKVLLLTDGQANQGITDDATLVGVATNLQGAGIGTTTIGYGAGFNEELLTAIADSAGGKSYFAASPEDAPGIFAQEFEDLASMVAQNLSVEIRPSDEVKVVGVLNEYPATSVEGGIQIGLGDVYSEENRRVVFELHIPEMARLGVCKVAELILRYVTVGDEVATHETVIPLVINMVSAEEAQGTEPDATVTEEVVILKAAQAQKEARRRADSGDFDAARKLLLDSADELGQFSLGSARADELREEASILTEQAGMLDSTVYSAEASKAMHYDSRRKHQARRRSHEGQ